MPVRRQVGRGRRLASASSYKDPTRLTGDWGDQALTFQPYPRLGNCAQYIISAFGGIGRHSLRIHHLAQYQVVISLRQRGQVLQKRSGEFFWFERKKSHNVGNELRDGNSHYGERV